MAIAATSHGHTAHDPLKFNRLGLWLFFFSETVLFGLLLSARFYLEGIEREHVDQQLGLIITIILLLSSLTAFTAETAIEHGNQKVAQRFLLATIALGAIFAVGVGYEWKTAEFTRGEAFGSVFFTMTGIHASHVVSGLGVLALVWWHTRRGKFNEKNHWALSGTVMYWHFVDVVWVFFYPALYLVK